MPRTFFFQRQDLREVSIFSIFLCAAVGENYHHKCWQCCIYNELIFIQLNPEVRANVLIRSNVMFIDLSNSRLKWKKKCYTNVAFFLRFETSEKEWMFYKISFRIIQMLSYILQTWTGKWSLKFHWSILCTYVTL